MLFVIFVYLRIFQIGHQVCVKRSIAEPRYGWGGETHHSVGKIIDIESDGLLIIDIPNRSASWQADPSDMEKIDDFKVWTSCFPLFRYLEFFCCFVLELFLVLMFVQQLSWTLIFCFYLQVGDWVKVKATVPSPKYGWEDVTRNSIGIVHSLEEDGDMGVAFCFRSKLFLCSVADVEKAQPFEVDEKVHVLPSISEPRLGWSNETAATIGAISRIDMDGTLNVKVSGRKSLWKVAPGDAERLSAFEVGDWVRLKPSIGSRPTYDWNSVGKISIAVVHSIQDSGYLELAGCFRKGKWLTHNTDIEKVQPFKIGLHVRFRAGIEPRWGWRGAKHDSRGIIAGVHADGELRVAFFGVPGLWRGDPADLEIEQVFEVGEWVRLKSDANDWNSLKAGNIGVVHGIGYEDDVWDGTIHVAFCGEQERWIGFSNQLERVSRFIVGQRVRIRSCIRQPRFGWSNHNHSSIGTISSIDADGKLRIHTPAGARAWLIDPAEVEKVEEEEEVCIGDWIKVKDSVATPTYQWGDVNHSSIGVVHRAGDGELWVSFCFCERLWLCKGWEVEKVRPFRQGDKVRIRPGLVTPRWGWGMETYASKGEVTGVDANGKLRIKFRWRDRLWVGDPADIILDDTPSPTETSNGFCS
jgi:E3 ubiquitin-protein ligase KEG